MKKLILGGLAVWGAYLATNNYKKYGQLLPPKAQNTLDPTMDPLLMNEILEDEVLTEEAVAEVLDSTINQSNVNNFAFESGIDYDSPGSSVVRPGSASGSAGSSGGSSGYCDNGNCFQGGGVR